MARSLVNVLEDRKGEEILLIDIQEIASFADYFILCNGSSNRMLQALADGLVEAAHQQYQLSTRTEGSADDGWLLVDLGDVVVHLFSPDQREYYQLEKLWSKGKVLVHLQ